MIDQKLQRGAARLETEPATRKQVGVIRQQFGRLDFTGDDRAERLAACAALLGLGELASTKDLTMGQAGQLYRMLLDFRDRDELAAAVALGGEDQAGEPAPEELAGDGVSLADALLRAMTVAFTAWQVLAAPQAPREGCRGRPGACCNASNSLQRLTHGADLGFQRRCNSLQRLTLALTWAFNAATGG